MDIVSQLVALTENFLFDKRFFKVYSNSCRHLSAVAHNYEKRLTMDPVNHPMNQVLGLGILNRIIDNYLNQQLKSLGLNSSTYIFIFYLADHPGASQDDLTKSMFLNHSTIARSVAKLVSLGFVEKQTDTEDKRASCLFLTSSGSQLLPHLNEISEQAEQKALGVLSETEQKTIAPLLDKAAKLNERNLIKNAKKSRKNGS